MKLRTATPFAGFALLALAIATPAAAVDSFFDVFTELPVVAPPRPSSPVITLVGDYFGGSFHATQQFEQSSQECRLNGLPPGEPVFDRMMGSGGGAGGNPPSIDSFFDVFIEIDLPVAMTGRRISDVRIVHPPGTPPGTWRLVPINPAAPPGSPESFFDIFYDVGFFDITYRVADDTGTHTLHQHCTSPSGRMSFFDVFVEIPPLNADGTIDSFFDVFVDFQMVGPQNPNVPDMHTHTTGQYDPGATPVAHRSWGAIKALYK